MNDGPIVMTVDELSEMLRLNRDTTYKAISARQISGVHRIGRSIRICRVSVEKWLQGGEPVADMKRQSP